MNLGYKTHFPWGAKTDFEIKIMTSRVLIGLTESDRRLCMAHIKANNSPYYYPKIHTMRVDAGDRWHRGRGEFLKIHHAIGVRTKNYRCFWVGECTGVQDVEIYWEDVTEEIDHTSPGGIPMPFFNDQFPNKKGRYLTPHVYIDSIEVDPNTIELLARNDGFDNTRDFFRWFNKDFAGKIIHWTDFRYNVDAAKAEEAYKVSLPRFSDNDLLTIQSLIP